MRRLAFIILLGLPLPANVLADEAEIGHPHPNVIVAEDRVISYQRFMREMDQGMEKMMSGMHQTGHSGNPDFDFLAMMIPHHQGAVDMARLELIHGKDPLTRKLAEEIIASQTTEIAAMRARLEILKRKVGPGEFPPLDGTRGEPK